MKYFSQITVFIVVVLHCFNIQYAKALVGINLKRQFEIEFKRAPLKSLEFIFEKWSRFGKLGIYRHKVERRDIHKLSDLNNEKTKSADEEKIVSVSSPVKREVATIDPLDNRNVIIVSTGKPIENRDNLPPDVLDNAVIPVEEPSNEIIPPGIGVVNQANFISPVAIARPINTAPVLPITPIVKLPTTVPPVLYTNILDVLSIPPNSIHGQTDAAPEKKETKPTNSLTIYKDQNPSLIARGSRLALHLGSILMKMLQVLASGRANADQLSGVV